METLNNKEFFNRLKISIFEKNTYNTIILATEIICIGKSKQLLQTCIELWSIFYVYSKEIPLLIQESINLIDTVKPKDIYKHDNIRLSLIKVCFVLSMTNKTNINYYNKNITKDKLNLLKDYNELSTFNINLLQKININIEKENTIYIGSILNNFGNNNIKDLNNILSYITSNIIKNDNLKIDFETIYLSLTKNYIWIILFIVKEIYNKLNNDEMNNYCKLYANIYEYNLSKPSIIKKINIVFLLFNILIDKNIRIHHYNSINYQNQLDETEVNNIFYKLTQYYELDTEIKDTQYIIKNNKKKNNKKNNSVSSINHDKKYTNDNENINEIIEDKTSPTDYLYTITYIDHKPKKRNSDINKVFLYEPRNIDIADYNINTNTLEIIKT
jgi:hypothetical protein